MNEEQESSGFLPPAVASQQGMMGVTSSRQAQEVQAAMVIAKKFPRNEYEAMQRIERACKRRGLAETAVYAYPKGATTVIGASIRMAECLAQNWGNLDFGILELEQKSGESVVMSYAWDLETNTRQTKVFTVRHERKVNRAIVAIEDPREIYEMVANQGARRMRACILGVIPGDVVESALAQCEKTLASGNEDSIDKRIRTMVSKFGEQGVDAAMLVGRLGHKLEVTTETELVQLRRIFTSLRDGMAKREDFFKMEVLPPRGVARKHEPDPAEADFAPVPEDGLAPTPEPVAMAEVRSGPVDPPIEVEQPKRRRVAAVHTDPVDPAGPAPAEPQPAPVAPPTAPVAPPTAPVAPPTAPVAPPTAPVAPLEWNPNWPTPFQVVKDATRPSPTELKVRFLKAIGHFEITFDEWATWADARGLMDDTYLSFAELSPGIVSMCCRNINGMAQQIMELR